MSKKKILHLTQATGGVKTYVAHVLEYADPNAFEFIIVAPADTLFEEFCAQRHIRYYRVDLERGLNAFKSFKVLWQVISIIHKERPWLIHAHSAKGGFIGRLAAKFAGVAVIYTPHAFSYLSFTGFKRMAFYFLEYLVRSWTTLVLAISYSEANTAIYELGYKKNKVQVILNAIPITSEATRPFHQHLKIGMIGRLTTQKNPMQFIEIAHRLLEKHPSLQFSVLGAGIHDDQKTEIEGYIVQNNLSQQIKIEKWGDAGTSQSFLLETDIYIATSIFEGLPFSLLEAMLQGIPCIVTKVDGNTDVIQNNENGYSCLSVDEFCDKIELMINDETLRLKIGRAGYDYVSLHHDIKKAVKKLEYIYISIS